MRRLRGLMVSSLLLIGPAWGKHWHDDEGDWAWHQQHYHDDGRAHHQHSKDCYFEPSDLRVISEYYATRHRSLPAGLSKKYYRTGHLPAGWVERIEPIPAAIEMHLVPLPSGYSRGIIDGLAVVYSPRTGAVIDVTVLFAQ